MKKNVKSACQEMDAEIRSLVVARKLDMAIKRASLKVRSKKNPVNLYSYALALSTYGFLKNNDARKKTAIKYYRQIIKLFPRAMHADLAEARICEETGRLKTALLFYKRAFKKCPTDLNAIHIANIYIQLNKKRLALHYYLIAEKTRKGSARHHLKQHFNR